jgi:hypothetical protein
MSSERFENLEFDFQDAVSNIRRLSSKIQNYQGGRVQPTIPSAHCLIEDASCPDQRQAAIREAQGEIEKADDYVRYVCRSCSLPLR